MPFQFYCPQRHLLEAAESHAGQPTQCPICGTALLIPQPPAAVTVAPVSPVRPAPPGAPPAEQFTASANVFRDPPAAATSGPASELDAIAAMRRVLEGAAAPAVLPPQEPQEELVHLSCPNGHELETPIETLGHDALCPHCRAQFRLRKRDTREYQAEQLRKEREYNRKVLHWSITAAAIVAIGLLGMGIYSLAT